MTATALYEIPLGVCTQDPDRWTTTPDEEAKTLRWQSATVSRRASGSPPNRHDARPRPPLLRGVCGDAGVNCHVGKQREKSNDFSRCFAFEHPADQKP